jgi:hypothetical protein
MGIVLEKQENVNTGDKETIKTRVPSNWTALVGAVASL